MSMTRKIISLLLVILLLPLVACDTQEEPFVMPQETDTLVIYDTPFLTESLLKAITLFRAQYPEVSVEFRRFDSVNNGDITAYHTMLYAELAAGQGPDIILESDTFTFNIGSFKRMESGVYADLEPFFQHDENFQMSDYHEIVLDAGVFQGKRYAVPLSFVSSYWLTTQEILEEEGITIEEDLQDYTSLMNLLQDYRQSNPEKRLFYNIYARQFLNDMFPWNGLPLVNIEEKQVSVDPDKLHYVIDTYRDVFYVESIVNAPSVIPNYGFGLLNRETIFQQQGTLRDMMQAYSALKTTETPILVNIPSFDGKVIGSPNLLAYIRENSPNQLNAYRFLKIMLSEEFQSDMYADGIELPVLRNAMYEKTEKILSTACVRGGMTEYGMLEFSSVSLEEVNTIIDTIYEVDACVIEPAITDLFVAMLPYITREKDFEDCYTDLTNQLTLLLNE